MTCAASEQTNGRANLIRNGQIRWPNADALQECRSRPRSDRANFRVEGEGWPANRSSGSVMEGPPTLARILASYGGHPSRRSLRLKASLAGPFGTSREGWPANRSSGSVVEGPPTLARISGELRWTPFAQGDCAEGIVAWNLSPAFRAKVGLPPVARAGSGERRVVDQTGIEPVTS